MVNYMFDNPRDYNEILQFVTLFLLIVIGVIVYSMNDNTEKIEKELAGLEMNCPECPKCPELIDRDGKVCPDIPQCPDCVCPEGDVCPTMNCPPQANCPTVDDIVSGIFPGRNAGVISSGRYFDVQANESYELMPDYDFYQPSNAFPSDSILTAPDSLLQGNVNIPPNQIANFQEYSSQLDTSINQQIDSRMNMSPPGQETGAMTLPRPPRPGQGTQTRTGEQARAAANQGPVDSAGRSREQQNTSRFNDPAVFESTPATPPAAGSP